MEASSLKSRSLLIKATNLEEKEKEKSLDPAAKVEHVSQGYQIFDIFVVLILASQMYWYSTSISVR